MSRGAARKWRCRHCDATAVPLGAQVRAVMHVPGRDGGRKELNQSPLPFIEATQQPQAHHVLARKDAIIRIRNAQASSDLRQPWRCAVFALWGKGGGGCPPHVRCIAV